MKTILGLRGIKVWGKSWNDGTLPGTPRWEDKKWVIYAEAAYDQEFEI